MLSPKELRKRRSVSRRRRARRRAGLAASIAIVIAVVVAVSAVAGQRSSRHRQTAAAAPTAGPRQPQAVLRPVRPAAPRARRVNEAAFGYIPYVELAGSRRREVALTFDDGPSAYTPQVLRILRRMRAAATFFLIGRFAQTYPQLVAKEAAEGFEVGDHTETHPFLSALSPGAQETQIVQAAEAIHRGGAPYPRLMRPPYGAFDHSTLEILRARRMVMVLWSADTKDYSRPGVARIIYTAVSGAQRGAIVLMHDGGGDRSQTVAALPRIIIRLRQRGFRLVTIARLLREDPPPANQPPPAPLSGR